MQKKNEKMLKFSVCKNNAYIFRLVHMKVSSTTSIKNDRIYLILLEILQFGNQFLGIHSILKKAVIYTNKIGGTFTVRSARKDLLKAVSLGQFLQSISVPFLWSWMFSIQFIEGWVFYVLSSTSLCKKVCLYLKTWWQTIACCCIYLFRHMDHIQPLAQEKRMKIVLESVDVYMYCF